MKLLAALTLVAAVGITQIPTNALTAPETKPAKVAATVPSTTSTTTSTTSTVPAVSVPADALCGQYWQLAVKVGWPIEQLPMLDRVIWRESRCMPNAWNGHDAGLTQINQIHKEFVAVMGWYWPEDLFKPEVALAFALKLWQGKGWQPWGF